jgi:hypothetical protein
LDEEERKKRKLQNFQFRVQQTTCFCGGGGKSDEKTALADLKCYNLVGFLLIDMPICNYFHLARNSSTFNLTI